MGYFVTTGHADIAEGERFTKHCFKHPVSGKLYDENGAEVVDECSILGNYVLHSYETIDDELASALGNAAAEEPA